MVRKLTTKAKIALKLIYLVGYYRGRYGLKRKK